MKTLKTRLAIVALASLWFTGCSTVPTVGSSSLKSFLPGQKKQEEPYPKPVKMAATWAPDTLSAPGKKTTRGFGGRLFFYNEKSQAIPVEGELMIVGYLDNQIEGVPAQAKRFGFTKEQFTRHFSQSDLGASYSVWIPWDAEGGPGQKITLVPSFTTPDGHVVQGAPTIVALTGPSIEAFHTAQRQRAGMRFSELSQRFPLQGPGQEDQQILQAGYQPQGTSVSGYPYGTSANTQPVTTPKSGITTTTIPMGNSGLRNR